jgi:hypothetical protein
MKNLDKIAEDLFNKIRSRFSSVTVGDIAGNVTDAPKEARFFDFDYTEDSRKLGNVSINISEDPSDSDKQALTIIYSKDFISNEDQTTQTNWFNFLKELRQFSKKRRLNFDIRDINKTNLDKRDYKFLANNRPGEGTMTESKLYGTSKVSYQNVDSARIVIKHTEHVNHELAAGRTQNIGKIYIESSDGERFMYPFKHLSGARAMARHVAEGGKPFDDFGKHIVGLSEEMSKLRKFKNYMGRSAVMAESLGEYMDAVHERIATVKKTIEGLQRSTYYKQTFEAFETPVFEDVPDEVAENWIDQLTIRQFNEELKDVFPYIYKLVSEVTKAKTLGADELMAEVAGPENCWDGYKKAGTQKGTGKNAGKRVNKCVPEDAELEAGFDRMMGQFGEGVSDLSYDAQALITKLRRDVEEKRLQPTPQAVLAAARELGGDMDFAPQLLVQQVLGKSMAEGAMDELAAELGQIADNEDYDKLYDLLSDNGPVGSYLQDMITDITVDTRLHPDDDIEKIMEIMMDRIADDFGDSDAETREGFSSEADQVLAQVGSGELDAYDVMNSPKTPAQVKAAEIIQQMYDEVSTDHQLHPDDDFEKILDIVADHLASDYGNSDADTEEAQAKEQKTPLGEFILAHYDRQSGKFPKGETAVLTMVEKDYGEQFIEPAKAFIERVNQTFEQFQMRSQPQQMETDLEFDRMRELAGLR